VALIVPKKLYPNAATWSSSTWQAASVLGKTFAGFSIYWIGVHFSLCIVFAMVVVSFGLLLLIPKKPIMNPKIGESIKESLKEGINFVRNEPAVLGALTLDMIAVLFGGAVALLPIFAADILDVGPLGYGFLSAATSVGAILTMLVTAYIPITKNAGMKLLVAIFGFGISIIIFGLSSIFWVSLLALFFSGVTDGVSMVIRQTILQLKTPDEMRGRVSAVNSMFVGSSNELGAFESGVAAKLMGAATAVDFGGTMTLITVVTTGFVSPSFRKLDLTKDMEAHQEEEA
jgi:MFS family permease